MTIVQEALWKYVADIWEHQNNIVHRKTEVETKQRKLVALRKQVKDILRSPPPLRTRDHHLLELGNVDRRQGIYLHHWIRAVRAAADQERIQRQQEERNKILEYMQEV